MKDIWKVSGLPKELFDKVVDEYLWSSETMNSEEYAEMNEEQKTFIQTVKRSRNRKNYKLKKKTK